MINILWFVCLTIFSFQILVQAEINETDLKFFFYSINNQKTGIETNLLRLNTIVNSKFSSKKETVFCIHGWRDTSSSTSCVNLKNAILDKHDVNFFTVDWSRIADEFYPLALTNLNSLGNILGSILWSMMLFGQLDFSRTTIIGHSLGAQLAGIAGNSLKGKVDLIVGLDPAGLGFVANKTDMLNTSSAKFVHVIHTGGRGLGYFPQTGHADYYPNGGQTQPMCGYLDWNCSHLRALRYYEESLRSGNFLAIKCIDYEDFRNGLCVNGSVSFMGGYDIDKKASGTYYLTTNDKPPYAEGEEGLFE